MRPIILLPMAILLTASVCGTRERPQPILVPTPVYCVTGDLPDEPRRVQPELTGDSGVDIGIIAGLAIELRAWGQALLRIAQSCRPPASQTPPSGL